MGIHDRANTPRPSEPVGQVFNHDFETYRRATGRGGDFIIYSDVLWEPVDMILELDLPKAVNSVP